MRTLASIIIIALCTGANSYAGNYTGISLSKLQSQILQGNHTEPISIERIMGIMVDENEDIILFGKKGENVCITIDDIAVIFRASLKQSRAPGVFMHKEYLPNASGMRLKYTGGIGNNIIGRCLGDCLFVFYCLANEKDINLEGFLPYKSLEKVQLVLSPQEDRCRRGPAGQSIYLLDGPGLTLKPKDGLNKETTQWINQLLTRSEELEVAYPQLRKLFNLFRLSILFKNIKESIDQSKWNLLLKHYKVSTAIQKQRLNVDDAKVLVNEITFCQERLDCNEVRDASIVFETINKRKPKEEAEISFTFDSEGATNFFKDKLYGFLQKFKKSDLSARGVFLNLDTQKSPPVLETVVADQMVVNKTATTAFQKLVDLVSHNFDDLDTPWKHFLKEWQLDDKSLDYEQKKQLVICSDKISPSWLNFYRINALKDRFEIYLVPIKKEEDFITSAEHFIDFFELIPRINNAKIGFIFSKTDNSLSALVEKLKKTVGKENVLINPTSSRFLKFISNRSLDTLFMDIDFENNKIKTKDGVIDRYQMLNLDRMDHIKYMAFGFFGSNPNKALSWEILRIFDSKGVGLISFTRPGEEKKDRESRLSGVLKILEDKETTYDRVPSFAGLLPSSQQTVFWTDIPQD